MSYNPQNANGQATMANSGSVVIASDQSSVPVAATLAAETTKAIGVTRTADGAGNLVTSTSNALDINIKTGNPTSITANAGTNLNTSALALETGGNLATIAGTVTSSVAQDNVKQINGVTPLMGNGTTGTGSLRVTLASDTTSNSNAFLVAGNKTNNNAAPAATQLGVMPALANAAAPSWTEGDQVLDSSDLSGNKRVTLGTLLAGEDLTVNVLKVEQRFIYANITTATTTTVKSGAGFLHSIVLNTLAASGSLVIYDNTAGSGTKIATITNPLTLLAEGPLTALYDVSFSTGLTIVTTGTQDITATYR